jgi:hypothetical protein
MEKYVRKLLQVLQLIAISVVCILIISYVLIALSVDYRVPDKILAGIWWFHTLAHAGNIIYKFNRKLVNKILIQLILFVLALLICFSLTWVWCLSHLEDCRSLIETESHSLALCLVFGMCACAPRSER